MLQHNEVSIYFHSDFPLLLSYISMVQLHVTIYEQILIYYQLKCTLCHISLIFFNVLFLFQNVMLYLAYLLRHLLAITWFFRVFLFLMTLIILSTDNVFCRMSLYLELSDVFLTIKLGVWIFGKKKESHSAILITEYQECILSTWHHYWYYP